MSVLTTDALECGYAETLLGPLDLDVPRGVVLLVEGPNGIGKSTLLQTLVGLVPPLAGSYEWRVDEAARRFVPQVRTLDPILPATVGDVVATGSQQGSKLGTMGISMSSGEVDGALERVGMVEHRGRLFRDLSEGQKQLVLLARALSGEPKALVLDEPTASMDPAKERRAVELLTQERDRRDATVVIVAHGSRHADEAADVLVRIDEERNVEWRDRR